MISLMRCSGLLLRTLTMVLSKVDLASLWNVMITEVGWSSVSQVRALQALLLVSGTFLLLAILSLASWLNLFRLYLSSPSLSLSPAMYESSAKYCQWTPSAPEEVWPAPLKQSGSERSVWKRNKYMNDYHMTVPVT